MECHGSVQIATTDPGFTQVPADLGIGSGPAFRLQAGGSATTHPAAQRIWNFSGFTHLAHTCSVQIGAAFIYMDSI